MVGALICDRCGRDVLTCTLVPSPCDRCRAILAATDVLTHGRRVDDAPADDVMPCGCCSGSCYCDDVAPMLDPDFYAHAGDYAHADALLAILAAHDAATDNQPKGA